MKKILLVGLLASTLVGAVAWNAWAQQTIGRQPSDNPVREAGGKYLLFQGVYTVNAKGTPFREEAVFRLNTETGEAWIYREGMTKERAFQKWESISD